MKKIKLVFFTCIFLFSENAISQYIFCKSFGNSLGSNLIECATDSSFYIGNNAKGFYTVRPDIRITKFNLNGDTLWSKFYGSSTSNQYATELNSMQLIQNNGLIISGTVGTYHNKLYLLKLDSAGNKLFSRNYEYSHAISFYYDDTYAEQTVDHGFIISGRMNDTSYSPYCFIMKLDSLGNIIWDKVFRYTTGMTYTNKVLEAPTGNFYLLGLLRTLNYQYRYPFLLALSPTGNILWEKLYGDTNSNCYTYDFKMADNSFYILNRKPDDNTTALINIDTLGNPKWEKTYSEMAGFGLTISSDSIIYIVGAGELIITPRLIKTNLDGDTISTTDYRVPDITTGASAVITQDSGIIMITAGISRPIIKTNLNGNTGCNGPSFITIDTSLSPFFSRPYSIYNFTLNSSIEINSVGRSNFPFSDWSNLCASVAVGDLNISNEIKIFPNPASFILKIETQYSIDQIELYNLFGEKILVAVDCQLRTVDCRLIPPGLYILQAGNREKVWRGKFIKE